MTSTNAAAPSTPRFRSRLPIRILNRIGGVATRLGAWPRLDVECLTRAARRAGWDPDRLPALVREGMEMRVRCYINEANLSPFGVLAMRTQLGVCLCNALASEQAVRQHPEILDERIERPLFILGLPRTGTTLLQRLLSLHEGARHLTFWEGYTPVPADLDHPKADRERRIREGRKALDTLYYLAPRLRSIHPMVADDPEECFYLFRNSFLIPTGIDVANLPGYWAWIDEGNRPRLVYEHYKRQLQLLQWIDRKRHWVLKCPLHFAAVPALLEVFPDARIVLTHRDPTEIIASLCSLVRVMWSIGCETVDDLAVGRYVLETSERLERSAEPALDRLGPDQRYDMDFATLMKDPVAAVGDIYARLGYGADPNLAAKSAAWLKANPREKHGRHVYALEDFGLDRDTVRRRLKG